MPRAVATLGTGKVYDDAGLLLHKRKDGNTQWIYRYTIHGRRREMSLGALRNVSLKKARECANQWRSVLHEGRDPIKVSALTTPLSCITLFPLQDAHASRTE